MKTRRFLASFLLTLAALATAAHAQRRPYVGYGYPAGGPLATTVQIKVGGQDLDDLTGVRVSGEGVSGSVATFFRRLNNQEVQLLNEQLKELKKPGATPDDATRDLIARIERRTREWVQTPACASISSLAWIDLTIAPDAEIGPRELRLVTARGVSNPIVFQVGQLREYARPAMTTALQQFLGKEAAALRKRPAGDAEVRVELPCTVNGQVASGEENRYRFTAGRGQRLVISTQARQLVPFIADAVPGWFQPVIRLQDARGREVAYADDYRFQPDPVILYQVPEDGEYVLSIRDAIHRGREDFVYRVTLGELPFITSVFPLGGPADVTLPPNVSGWNLADADLFSRGSALPADSAWVGASRLGFQSNRVPFALDTLPEVAAATRPPGDRTPQPVTLPVIVNGRIDRADDSDVFEFTGQAGKTVVAEVQARRLDSPLDSVVALLDARGRVLASNDDREDLTAGVNTHAADSYLSAKLPADGVYRIRISDTSRRGGEEYGYRLRLSEPRPDFDLRVVPSSLSLPVGSTAAVTVYVARRDGFTGPIKLALSNAPAGFSAAPVTIPANQNTARFTVKGPAAATPQPVALSITGTAKPGAAEIVRVAVPAEDRMQAFLWRHLVPAGDLPVLVFDPKVQPAPRHPAPVRPAVAPASAAAAAAILAGAPAASTAVAPPAAPKFTKQQIVGRLRQLKLLYEEELLTDAFYAARVAECDVSI